MGCKSGGDMREAEAQGFPQCLLNLSLAPHLAYMVSAVLFGGPNIKHFLES